MRSPYSHHIGASWTCAFIVNESFVRTKRHKPFVKCLCHSKLTAISVRGWVVYLVW